MKLHEIAQSQLDSRNLIEFRYGATKQTCTFENIRNGIVVWKNSRKPFPLATCDHILDCWSIVKKLPHVPNLYGAIESLDLDLEKYSVENILFTIGEFVGSFYAPVHEKIGRVLVEFVRQNSENFRWAEENHQLHFAIRSKFFNEIKEVLECVGSYVAIIEVTEIPRGL